jgi:2-polyprenyl-6-methoxyphenol hydroxylase-like FAD-dependent oxidoreductase
MPEQETIREPAREIPVYGRCDVLVVGGGPAGSAAAASAARMGADTILVERYGHLGGMSTGGFVTYIERMTDWSGRQVIAGFANELLDRLPREAVLGPADELWGSRDPRLVEYWQDRSNAHHGVITWSPTVDPEMLKIVSNDLLLERGVKLLLHSWAVAPVQEGNEVRGVIFESKEGRKALLAQVVIDATGDGDIFAMSGAPFEGDIEQDDIHHKINVAFMWGGVDMERYFDFRRQHQDEFRAITQRGSELGLSPDSVPHAMPRNDVALFMGPRLSGYSATNVNDLTEVEVESRRRMMTMLDFYRRNMPGFNDAWIMATAPQMGTRHSRRLAGVKKVVRDEWTAGKLHEDEIGISPPPNPRSPNVSIPLGCLIPVGVDNLLAAGRNLSCDAATHTFLRLIPQCWEMGQAAGVAATVAIQAGTRVRDVDVSEVRRQLVKQGVVLHKEAGGLATEEPAQRSAE